MYVALDLLKCCKYKYIYTIWATDGLLKGTDVIYSILYHLSIKNMNFLATSMSFYILILSHETSNSQRPVRFFASWPCSFKMTNTQPLFNAVRCSLALLSAPRSPLFFCLTFNLSLHVHLLVHSQITEAPKVFRLLHRFPGYNEARTIVERLYGEAAKHSVSVKILYQKKAFQKTFHSYRHYALGLELVCSDI